MSGSGRDMLRVLGLAGAVLLSASCDRGHSIYMRVTVPAHELAKYGAEHRGLLAAYFEGPSASVAFGVICESSDPLVWDISYLREASDDAAFTGVTVWIDPLPADDPRSCGQFTAPSHAPGTIDAREPQAHEDIEPPQGCSISTHLELVLSSN